VITKEQKYERTRQWKKANMAYVLEYNRQYRQSHPELFKELDRRKYLENIDAIKARQKIYRQEKADLCRACDKAKRIANPALYHAIHVRNKAIRRSRQYKSDDGTVTIAIVRQLFELITHCPYCGVLLTEQNRHLDHKQPLSKGGKHTLANVIPCCGPCNVKKAIKPYYTFLKECGQ
jgi:5-methylcytosine-specific restriction endonuclease McrA